MSLALLSSAAFAKPEICHFDSTADFHEAMELSKVGRQVGMNADHSNFSFLENTMIHQTVTGQEWQRDLSMEQALAEFADYNEYEPGPGPWRVRFSTTRSKIQGLPWSITGRGTMNTALFMS